MSTSNSFFSGVSNDELPTRLVASSVVASSADIGTITTQSIRTENIHVTGIPKSYSQTVIQATADFDASDYALLSKGHIFVETAVNTTLHLSKADSAAEATRLLKLFNITDKTTTRLLTVSRVNAITANTISLGNGVGISTGGNVQFTIGSTAPARATSNIVIATANSVRESFILISKVDALTPSTGDAILFHAIGVA